MSKQEEIREWTAKQLYLWLHPTCSPDWESKKLTEVVRVGHRQRAEVLLKYLHSQGLRLPNGEPLIKEGE